VPGRPADAAVARGDIASLCFVAGRIADGLEALHAAGVFHGDLEGTSRGEMLSAGTATKGSAGYVAIERVSGALAGKRGTFVLQHSGTMNRGAQQLTISVVPDSGSGELAGLSGTMTIIIGPGGRHDYEFEYTLSDSSA